MLNRRETLAIGASVLACAGLSPLQSLAATAPDKATWRKLFDGRSLQGWTVFQQGVGDHDAHRAITIRNGILHFLGPAFDGPNAASFGHLATSEEFSDYHLRLDYRWGERRFAPRDLQRRNSGILYHMAPDRDRLFPDCVEFQVEEGDVGDAVTLNTKALHGPRLGGTPLWPNWIPAIPRKYEEPINAGGIARQWLKHAGPYEKLDDWNTLDLLAFGDQAAHLVNGRIVNTLFGLVDRHGAPLQKGRIALEFEAAEIAFRNISIRALDGEEIARIKAGR
jgi:Domain of Unknown Function (DUF1080)